MSAPQTFPNAQAVSPDLAQLERLIEKAIAAREAVRDGQMLCTVQGQALVNAAYDLFQVDGLYDLAEDIAADMAPEPPTTGHWMNQYLPHGLGRPA